MARGIDRRTGRLLEGWPYTLAAMETVLTTPLGQRVMREYVGSLGSGLLVRENVTASAIERYRYALTIMWDLWVPMIEVLEWGYASRGDERAGGIGMTLAVDHRPNAHLGDYATAETRELRAVIAARGVRLTSL